MLLNHLSFTDLLLWEQQQRKWIKLGDKELSTLLDKGLVKAGCWWKILRGRGFWHSWLPQWLQTHIWICMVLWDHNCPAFLLSGRAELSAVHLAFSIALHWHHKEQTNNNFLILKASSLRGLILISVCNEWNMSYDQVCADGWPLPLW